VIVERFCFGVTFQLRTGRVWWRLAVPHAWNGGIRCAPAGLTVGVPQSGGLRRAPQVLPSISESRCSAAVG
jgi:hypothetical protein